MIIGDPTKGRRSVAALRLIDALRAVLCKCLFRGEHEGGMPHDWEQNSCTVSMSARLISCQHQSFKKNLGHKAHFLPMYRFRSCIQTVSEFYIDLVIAVFVC